MNEIDRAIYQTQARRAARAAELAAQGPAAPDPVELAMRQHDAIMAEAKARADAIIPTGRQAVTPAPEPVRPAWDVLIPLLVSADFSYSEHLSSLLAKAFRHAGEDKVLAALRAHDEEIAEGLERFRDPLAQSSAR